MQIREALTPDERRAKVAEILARGLVRLAAARAASRRGSRRPVADSNAAEYPQTTTEI